MLNGRTPGVTLQEGRMAGRDDMFALAPVPWGQALRRGAMLALGAIALTACTTTPRTVSVVDRTTPARSTTATTGSSASTPGTTPDGRPVSDAETYVVKRGDTLYQIALDHGQDWRDIAQWSALEDANQLRVGQVLRVRRPGSAPPGGRAERHRRGPDRADRRSGANCTASAGHAGAGHAARGRGRAHAAHGACAAGHRRQAFRCAW